MRTVALVLGAIAFAVPASAATVVFELSGSQVTTCWDEEDGAACAEYAGGAFDLIGTSFDGTIALDLAALGLPHLANQTINVSVDPSGAGADGIFMDLAFIGPRFHEPTGGATFRLVTDGNADPVSWLVDVADGPPDYFVSDQGLSVFYPGPVYWEGTPGTLRRITPAPIPLPPAGFLLAGALGLFGMWGVSGGLRRRAGAAA
jgi:hypothetical protein